MMMITLTGNIVTRIFFYIWFFVFVIIKLNIAEVALHSKTVHVPLLTVSAYAVFRSCTD